MLNKIRETKFDKVIQAFVKTIKEVATVEAITVIGKDSQTITLKIKFSNLKNIGCSTVVMFIENILSNSLDLDEVIKAIYFNVEVCSTTKRNIIGATVTSIEGFHKEKPRIEKLLMETIDDCMVYITLKFHLSLLILFKLNHP